MVSPKMATVEVQVDADVAFHTENKDQSVFDPVIEAQKVPNTHVLTRDQKDAFDVRTYKADNKEPVVEIHLDEP